MEQNNTIGTLLKNQREKKNISLDDVAKKTKININILRSLEGDELHNLPNKTYVRGFVANYAKTINLDINDAKNALENTYQIKFGHLHDETSPEKKLGALQADNPEDDQTEEIKETIISIAQGFLSKKVIYTLIVLAIIFLIIKGIVNFFSQLNFESKEINNTTPSQEKTLKAEDENLFESQASKKFLNENLVTEKETSQKTENTDPTPSDQKLESKEAIVEEKQKDEEVKPVKKEESDQTQDQAKNLNGKLPYENFYPAPTQLYTIVNNADETSDAALLPHSIKNAMDTQKQNVYIVAAEGDTWISYKVDEQKIKRYVLRKGRTLFLQGETILLFMGNYNVSKVFLNNQLISAQTKTGVKSFIFPQSEAENYEFPLFPSHKGLIYSAKEYKEKMAPKPSN
ncbi:MAG: helix-turn-helix domain-containing protein [Bacteriovoracaceae bacterium]|jgi:cytoskeletal protein RodZ|nr:helix-turn-helix domain-containing protein [Bacteriovoracaceae bacterium]